MRVFTEAEVRGRASRGRKHNITIKESILCLAAAIFVCAALPAFAMQRTVTVGDADELMQNIAQGTRIVLKAGEYALDCKDSFIMQNTDNITIQGAGAGKTVIIAAGTCSIALGFNGCRSLTLSGLSIECAAEPRRASALVLNGCSDVLLDGIEIRGKAAEGVSLLDTSDLTVRDCVLSDCTDRLLVARNLSRAKLTNVKFAHTGWFAPLHFDGATENVVFEKCSFGTSGEYVCVLFADFGMNYSQKKCSFESCDFGDYGKADIELPMKYEGHMKIVNPKYCK